MIVGGAHHYELTHSSTAASTFASLAQIGPFFSILLYFFSSAGLSPGSITISRAAAVVSIILYLMYLGFRHTHEQHFDAEAADRVDEHTISIVDHCPSLRVYLGSGFALLATLVLLIFVTEDVCRIVQERSRSFQSTFALLIVPFAIKIWLWLEILKRARASDTFDAVIDETAGASIHMSLLFGPVLVLLGQAQSTPMTFRFGLLETSTYGLTSILLTSVLPEGRSNYLKGIFLVWTYLLVKLQPML
jgi:Ca2+:H+ antiporter